MENEAVKLKQIVSMIIIKKKIPEEIEKIVLASNKDYAEIARKLINAIKELDLTEIQKEKVKWIESYNENDCKEDAETLKYLSLTQYENKKDDIINTLESLITKTAEENKKYEKSTKTKKLKIDNQKVESIIKNKQENFNFSNEITKNVMDEIKSSKKGMLNYLSTVQFTEEQQKKVDKYVRKFEDASQLVITSTVFKTVKVRKLLEIQDNEIYKEIIQAIKNYSIKHEEISQYDIFRSKREIFVENLQETVEDLSELEKEDEEEINILREIEMDEK